MTATQKWRVGPYMGAHSAVSNLSIPLDATTDRFAPIFWVPGGKVITHLGFITHTIGTPPNYRISLQAIDSSGLPDGTVKGGGSPASVTLAPTGTQQYRWYALDNSYTVSAGGELLAAPFEYASGSVDASNMTRIYYGISGFLASQAFAQPYFTQDTGSGWTKGSPGGMCYGWRTASERGGFPANLAAATQAATNGHRAAAKINFPTTLCQQLTISGFECAAALPNTGSAKFGIWDSAGTEIASRTFDTDARRSNSVGLYEVYFTDPVTLTAGTDYYIGWERVDVTLTLYGWDAVDSSDRAALPMGDVFTAQSTWNGSAWTDGLGLSHMELIVTDWIRGLHTHPGMNGGLRG